MIFHDPKSGWTVALGSAIGRAIGNNLAELKQARTAAQTLQDAPTLPTVGAKVSIYHPTEGKRLGVVVGYVEGYHRGSLEQLLEVEFHNGNNAYRKPFHPSRVEVETTEATL